ncbi:hypothetical protein [Paraburkholderia fungorum]|uniref:hypothetical protein n=1 Tax=Paraburkholderia fungorum TaxID=134537 RepID=UPI00387797BD
MRADRNYPRTHDSDFRLLLRGYMYRIDDPSASPTLPVPEAALTEGYWTEGNPGSGIIATLERASWFNMVQEELRAIVVAAGLTPSKTTYNQVLSAIKRIGQNTVVLADTGAANAYTAVNAVPLVAGTWVDGVVQAVKIAHTNTGASTYAPDGLTAIPIYGLGLQPLQGGELLLNGTAILMHATIAGVNSGNPICVLMECAGGAQQVPPATASQHAVQFGQVAGVVGQARNLVCNLTTAGTTKVTTADEVVVETALGGLRYCLSGINVTGNISTQMDTGSAPASGFVAEYLIYNPNAAISATNPRMLYTNATSAIQPNIYGGAHPVSGYTASALVSVWPTNGSGQFAVAYQQDRTVEFARVNIISTSTPSATYTPFSFAGVVPPNATALDGDFAVNSTTSSSLTILIASNAQGVGARAAAFNSTAAGQGITSPFGKIKIAVTQSAYYIGTSSAGTPTFTITASSYDF